MKKNLLAIMMLTSQLFCADTVEHTFESGTAIKASEMNANFTLLSSKISELRSLIAGNSSATATREYVGMTTQTVNGGTGILNMNGMCDAQFTGSRMCTSDDIVHSINPNSGDSGYAWLHSNATIQAYSNVSTLLYDVLGTMNRLPNCYGWRSATIGNGGRVMQMFNGGGASMSNCDDIHPISCCK